MSRILAPLSAISLLAAVAHAQCLGAPTGTVQTLTSTSGGLYPIHDEGRTVPAVALGFSFPMAGAAFGPFTHAFVESNGEIYLSNTTYGLISPAGPAVYGITSLDEMRGTGAAFSNPRIAAFGGDNEAGNGGTWGIYVDTLTPNQCTIHWHDMQDYNANVGYMSADWAMTLHSTGDIDFTFGGGLPPASYVGCFSGVSIGNSVGTGAELSADLSAGADSGSLGLLYESWVAGAQTDLSHKKIRISPNGLGGFTSTVLCEGASHTPYGAGCYDDDGASQSFYEFFAAPAAVNAQLTGTSITMTPSGPGYVVTSGGGAYLAPSVGATTLALTDDSEVDVTPSVPFPHVSGPITTLGVNSNASIVMAATPTGNTVGIYGSVFALLNDPIAAFRSNSDYDPGNSPGVVKSEEVGGVLYLTWENVERWAVNGSSDRFQFQMNLTTGVVVIVWDSMASASGGGTVVGYAPGLSNDGGSIDLATALPILLTPDTTPILPLTMSASPAPTFTIGNPSVPITYTVDNLRDLAPPVPGFFLATLVFSFNPPIIPGGIDLTFLGVDAPGCNLLVGSLDVLYNIAPTATLHNEVIVVPQPLAPGTTFYVQAVNFLIPNSLPNGLNNFGVIVSNGVKSKFDLF